MIKGSVRGGHNYTIVGASGLADEVIEDRKYYPFVINGLQRNGFEMQDVTPNRTNTKSDDLLYGVSKANVNGSNFFISCHLNEFDGTARGCEVIHHSKSKDGEKLAICIAEELNKLGFPYHTKPNGAKADDRGLYELRNTDMTAVIVEPFFCDNAEDVALYKRLGSQAIGEAISNGVLKYYGKTPIKTKTTGVNYCMEFQKFYNATTKTKAPLKEDGVYGDNTNKAYETLGKLIRGEY